MIILFLVNNELLPNSTPEPGAPRKIFVEVARQWLHTMKFKVKRVTKGIYDDGHERADVVEARGDFLKTMTSLGFLNRKNALNEEVARLLPTVTVHLKRGKPFFGSTMKAVTMPMLIK